MRLGYTIAFNAKHHLEHNDYCHALAEVLDEWVIVEGLALPGGSTGWCNQPPDHLHHDGHSVDGTVELLENLRTECPNVHVVTRHGAWSSKDAMVNAATDALWWYMDGGTFLWQIDADEQWDSNVMIEAENALVEEGGNTGMFLADHYIGKHLVARGEWGEGRKLPYRRLWRWDGRGYSTHEPPELEGGNGVEKLLPQRFSHYAYYFDQDVQFKEQYYGGCDGLYSRWLRLQNKPEMQEWPQPLSALGVGSWDNTDTSIFYVP